MTLPEIAELGRNYRLTFSSRHQAPGASDGKHGCERAQRALSVARFGDAHRKHFEVPEIPHHTGCYPRAIERGHVAIWDPFALRILTTPRASWRREVD